MLELERAKESQAVIVIHISITNNHSDYDELKGGDFGLIHY